MDDQFLGHELEEWYPQEPTKGPPLPRFLNIYWPWYKGAAPPPVVPPAVYTCPYCGATFATEAEKNYHIQTQHAAPPEYTCPYCGATFATEAERDSHVQTQHPTPPPTVYTCPYCGATFSTQADLDAHIQTEHPAPPGQANLTGVVTNARTGAPLAGVRVGPFMGTQYTSTNPSDATGYYLVTDIGITGSGVTVPSSYPVTFEKAGYQTLLITIDLVEGQNTLNAQLAPVTQLELPIWGGVIIGVNGQPFSEVGQTKEPLNYYRHKSYLTWDELAQHIVEYHPERVTPSNTPSTCPYCGAYFDGYAAVWDLIAHIVSQHLPPPPPYTCPFCGATGEEFLIWTVQQYTGYGKLATPIELDTDLRHLTINIIDRLFSQEYYRGGVYEMQGIYLAQTPVEGFGVAGRSGVVDVPSVLPARLDLDLANPGLYWPELQGVAGVTYDLFIYVTARVGGAGAVDVKLIKNAVRCI